MRAEHSAILIALLILVPGPARAQVAQSNLWVANGAVNAIALAGNTVYMGGEFTRLGPPTGGFVTLDETTGAVVAPGAGGGVAGTVMCSLVDAGGGRFVGGSFQFVQGQSHSGLAHFDSNGNLLPWSPSVGNGYVYAMAIDYSNPNVLYIGGVFSSVNGVTRNSLAAIDVTTGALLDWNPGTNGLVNAMVAYNGVVYVGGSFTMAGGYTRNDLAAVDGTGAVTGWDPNSNGDVNALALSANPFTHLPTIWIGGLFTSLQGQARYSIGCVDVTGTPLSWSPNADHAVRTIVLGYSHNFVNAVYLGGTFDLVAGQSRQYLAEVDPSTGVASSTFNPSPDQPVSSIALDGTSVYVGGSFTRIGGVSRQYLAGLDATSGAVSSWDPSPDAGVACLDAWSGTVRVGGAFGSLGGVTRNHLAALDATTGMPTSWDPNASGPINALTVNGGTLYAGGQFATIVGQNRGNGAAFNSGGTLLSWDPRTTGPINALAGFGGSIYVGGGFLSAGGPGNPMLARLDPSSGNSVAPLPTPDRPVHALMVRDSVMYVGGEFQRLNGFVRSGAGAFDLKNFAVTNWDPEVLGASQGPVTMVDALAQVGNLIALGGDFLEVHFAMHTNLALVDPVVGFVAGWYSPVYQPVLALLDLGNTLCAGGYFVSSGPGATGPLAAIDLTSLAARPWNTGMTGEVHSLAAGAGALYVGGSQSPSAGGWPHENFAAFSGGVTAVNEEPVAPLHGAIHLSSNPSRGSVTFSFALPGRTATEVTVFDAAGRVVRSLHAGDLPAGELHIMWDGRDDTGRFARSGVYFVRIRGANLDLEAKLIHLH